MNKQLINLFPLMCLLFFALNSAAQSISSLQDNERNMLKFNALTLLGGKFSFEYERMLTDRISVGTAISIRPKKGLPFRSTVKKLVNDEELESLIDGFKSSNFSITPEVRFYTRNKGFFRGFYIAPYIKYASYTANLPLDFDVEFEYDEETYNYKTETIPLEGNITSFTAGVSFGVNYKLSKKVHLDWRIIGPGYGFAKGDITGKMALDNDEVLALNEELDSLKEDLGDLPLGIKIDYKVSSEGAEVKINRSPWASIRTGLSIAYRF